MEELRTADKKKLTTIANDLVGVVNGGRQAHFKYFIEKVAWSHRTLQQSLMRNFIIPLLKQWAENADNGWYDLRNEATCKMAKHIVETAIEPWEKDQGLPYV